MSLPMFVLLHDPIHVYTHTHTNHACTYTSFPLHIEHETQWPGSCPFNSVRQAPGSQTSYSLLSSYDLLTIITTKIKTTLMISKHEYLSYQCHPRRNQAKPAKLSQARLYNVLFSRIHYLYKWKKHSVCSANLLYLPSRRAGGGGL